MKTQYEKDIRQAQRRLKNFCDHRSAGTKETVLRVLGHKGPEAVVALFPRLRLEDLQLLQHDYERRKALRNGTDAA